MTRASSSDLPNPDKINYIRVATTDDIQGPAVAQFAYNDLSLKNVAIVDDLSVYGKGIADTFSAEFTKLGGKVVDREGADPKTTDYSAILTKFAGLKPDSVFFGGVTANGGGLAPQADAAGRSRRAAVPRRRRHPGPERRRLRLVHQHRRGGGRQLVLVRGGHPRHPDAAAFATKYTAEYKADPGAYSASGYACAQIIIAALSTAAAKGDITRENVRAAATDTSTTFTTVLGPVQFDSVGDTNQKIISLYKVDPTASSGKGDWAFVKQINYGGQ